VYHVKPGDTLSKISMAYGVSSTDLANANGLKESAMLHPNQTLNIPAAAHGAPVVARSPVAATTTAANTVTTAAADPKKNDFLKAFNANAGAAAKTHTVAKGETATSIAKKYGVSQDDLLKLNSVSDPKKLQIGQTLKLPSKSTKTLAETAG
jgi:LysM repeat protein